MGPGSSNSKNRLVSFEVQVVSSGLCWRRHQDQLRLRYCEAYPSSTSALEAVSLPSSMTEGR